MLVASIRNRCFDTLYSARVMLTVSVAVDGVGVRVSVAVGVREGVGVNTDIEVGVRVGVDVDLEEGVDGVPVVTVVT